MLLSNCTDRVSNESTECWSFDVRQCGTDQYADLLIDDNSTSSKEQKIKTWLEENGATVARVRIAIDFHEGVCEACHVCPVGDRIFVQFEKGETPDAEALELLNFELNEDSDCL